MLSLQYYNSYIYNKLAYKCFMFLNIQFSLYMQMYIYLYTKSFNNYFYWNQDPYLLAGEQFYKLHLPLVSQTPKILINKINFFSYIL